ncbi:MAG TPA: hypothetical protein VI727_03655 [Candidatus Brocadiaceae bacterium]|nr:hypothetical protein [Candidatus Brocadiaceae bacterium]
MTALREALLNAVVHGDYTNSSDIQIEIFDDRPGTLSALWGHTLISDYIIDNKRHFVRHKAHVVCH